MKLIKKFALLTILILYLVVAPSVSAGTFSLLPDLEQGDTHSGVTMLQKFLNSNGYIVNEQQGQPGSVGYESTYFGTLTQKALSLFQSNNNIVPAAGYFGTKTKRMMDERNIANTSIPNAKSAKLSGADTSTCSAGQARSITQFGITWYFDKCYQYGTFANGDYWAVGPVVITKITPGTQKEGGYSWNGTMINPSPSSDNNNKGQGFDSRQGKRNGLPMVKYAVYSPTLDVDPANTGRDLSVGNNNSVLSSISTPGITEQIVGDGRGLIQTMAVLTILPSAPREGSFRPPISGSDKSIKWNKNDLNYGVLKSYAPVVGTPSLSTVEQYFEKPWITQWEGNMVQEMSPVVNMPNYGRDQAYLVEEGLLSLNLNYSNSQKEKLYVRLVQYGIDVYGTVKEAENSINKELPAGEDGFYRGSGGLNVGRKAPMVLAGIALNDSNIKAFSNGTNKRLFHEDKQTFFVTQRDVNMARFDKNGVGQRAAVGQNGCHAYSGSNCLRVLGAYNASHIGIPEWTVDIYDSRPQYAGSNWGAFYRNVNGPVMVGHALGIQMIEGGVSTWNWPAFFAYSDRYWSTASSIPDEIKNAQNKIHVFTANMWRAYRGGGAYTPPTNTGPTDPVVVPPTDENEEEPSTSTGIPFSKWNLVKVSSNTGSVNVRNNTYIADTTKIGTQSNGATGQIIDGPVDQDGVRWWKINYDNSEIDGWTGQSNTSGTDNLTVTAIGTEPAAILVSPKIISPSNNTQFPAGTKKVTIRWENKNTNYLVRYKEVGSSEVQKNTYTKEDIDIDVADGESYTFWIHSGVATIGKWSEPKSEISFSILTSQDDTIDSDTDGVVDSVDRCPNTPLSLKSLVNGKGCIKPKTDTFDLKKNIDNEDLSSISNFEIGKTGIAKIKFNQAVDLSGSSRIDLDSLITIENKKVYVNSALAPQLNKPATVTLYNIDKAPLGIKRNGVEVDISFVYDAANKTLTFTVPGFSWYELIEEDSTSGSATTTSTVATPSSGGGGGGGGGGGSSSTKSKTKTQTFQSLCSVSNTKVGSGSSVSLDVTVKNAVSAYTIKWSGASSKLKGFDKTKEDQTFIVPNKKGTYTLAFEAKDKSGKKAKVKCPSIKVDKKYVIQQAASVVTSAGVSPTLLSKNLSLGQTDEQVKILQKLLNNKGFLIASKGLGSFGYESSYFGELTRQALLRFQKTNNLSQTGIADEKTREILNK